MPRFRPTYSLEVPSLYDNCELSCRIYDPLSNEDKVALVAHPYAPMGGSFDNPIVGVIGMELLKAGYMVGTFNFR